MRLQIRHHTSYVYERPVPYGLQQARLTPRSSQTQLVQDWTTTVVGGHVEVEFSDHHLNLVSLLGITEDAYRIELISEGSILTSDTNGVDPTQVGFAPLWLYLRTTPLTKAGVRVHELVEGVKAEDLQGNRVAQMHELSAQVGDAVRYEVGTSHAESTAEEVLDSGHGVCQDHAHVFVSAARLLNIPARYVSGYLMMDDQVEQSATHAWAEVWIDGLGWVGFDASNGISPDERYVRVAVGLDYDEAAPIAGLRYGGGAEHMTVQVQVQQ